MACGGANSYRNILFCGADIAFCNKLRTALRLIYNIIVRVRHIARTITDACTYPLTTAGGGASGAEGSGGAQPPQLVIQIF